MDVNYEQGKVKSQEATLALLDTVDVDSFDKTLIITFQKNEKSS